MAVKYRRQGVVTVQLRYHLISLLTDSVVVKPVDGRSLVSVGEYKVDSVCVGCVGCVVRTHVRGRSL